MDVPFMANNQASVGALSITNVPKNIFATGLLLSVVGRVGVLGFTIQNNSIHDWFMGFDNTVSTTTGIKIPKNGGSVSRFYGGQIVKSGVWVVSENAGPDVGLLEQAC